MRRWPLFDTRGMDRSRAVFWPEPHLALDADGEEGPVVVSTTYTVASEREEAFLRAMGYVRRSRLRTGARQWGLFRDGEQPQRFVELFVVPTWEEHLRQHQDRLTATDQAFDEEARALSNPPPETSHLLAAEVEH